MPRKVYSDQFKRDAVAMYENDPQVSLNAAAGECPILCVRGFGLQVVRESVGVSHG